MMSTHGYTLTGQVLSVTHMKREHPLVDEKTGQVQPPFDYHRIRLLVGDETKDVKADHSGASDYGPRETWQGPLPEVGQVVTVDVEVGAWKDRTTGRAQVSNRGLRLSAARPAAVSRAS